MRNVLSTLAGVGVAVVIAAPAMAQTASINNGSTATVNGTFDLQSITTSLSDLSFQYGTLVATGAGTFTFSYLGNESGYVNGFSISGGGVLTEQSAPGASLSFVVAAGNLMPSFTFMTTSPTGLGSASNGQSFTDSSNPSFAIIGNSNGGNVMASYGNTSNGFQYVLGFNDAYSGDRDFDDYKVGVNFVAAPVPEPSTYALMLAGLAAVGFMARRRRS